MATPCTVAEVQCDLVGGVGVEAVVGRAPLAACERRGLAVGDGSVLARALPGEEGGVLIGESLTCAGGGWSLTTPILNLQCTYHYSRSQNT